MHVRARPLRILCLCGVCAGHPHHPAMSAIAQQGFAKLQRARKRLSVIHGLKTPRPDDDDSSPDAYTGDEEGLSFAEECAMLDASVPKDKRAEWARAHERLRKAEAAWSLLQHRHHQQQQQTEDAVLHKRSTTEKLQDLLERWQAKKGDSVVPPLQTVSNPQLSSDDSHSRSQRRVSGLSGVRGEDGARREMLLKLRAEEIDRRIKSLTTRLERARAREHDSLQAVLPDDLKAAEEEVLAARAAARMAAEEEEDVKLQFQNACRRVEGRRLLQPRPEAATEEEAEEEEEWRGGQLKGQFLLSHAVAGGGDKIDFVVCKFGCSESLKGKVADDYGDRESVVRSRFVVDEDFCLTFDDKHGASMYPLLANPVLLDSQVAQPKAMAQQMVVCRGGRCAAGAKAQRASLAKAKCLVISLDTGGRELQPPGVGLGPAEAADIDIPVFAMSREHEEALLSAASVRVCLLAKDRPVAVPGLRWLSIGPTAPAEGKELIHDALAEALRQKDPFSPVFSQEEWDAFGITGVRSNHYVKSGTSFFQPERPGDEGDDDDSSQERKQENILHDVPVTYPKGSKELLSKWGRWMNRVGLS